MGALMSCISRRSFKVAQRRHVTLSSFYFAAFMLPTLGKWNSLGAQNACIPVLHTYLYMHICSYVHVRIVSNIFATSDSRLFSVLQSQKDFFQVILNHSNKNIKNSMLKYLDETGVDILCYKHKQIKAS